MKTESSFFSIDSTTYNLWKNEKQTCGVHLTMEMLQNAINTIMGVRTVKRASPKVEFEDVPTHSFWSK